MPKDKPCPPEEPLPNTGTPPLPNRASLIERLRDRLTLTPDQADTLARVKFPCC